MESFTEEDWLNELREFYPQQRPRQPGDFTVAEYARAEGIEHKCAHLRLFKLFKEGKLTRVEMPIDGHVCHVYFKT